MKPPLNPPPPARHPVGAVVEPRTRFAADPEDGASPLGGRPSEELKAFAAAGRDPA
ncbi:hypothetical protein AB0B45_22740 [Nonomuraea sp. NPDC049152]|uniref:hypothetical protein n=1 Tax=Nonomuraea sp. NPDC049152 TaxID=3154350 RepID=UPI0033C28F68